MLKLMLYLTSMLTVVYGTVDFRSSLNLTGLDCDAWWGPSEHRYEDTSIKRIELVFSDEMIQDLKYRLRHRRPITSSLEGTWFDYGINSHVADEWLDYWENGYPFKERQDFINRYPHYMTNIQGLDIHFIRVRPKVPKHVVIVPLLLTNGWPSSFAEFYEVIPRLAAWGKDRDFAVEVIAPTIPGFILSEAAVRPGLGAPEVAIIFRKLMHRLGHKTYYMASSDLGYVICNVIATVYPEDVLGFYTQFVGLMTFSSRIPFLLSAIPLLNNSHFIGNFSKGRTRKDDIQHMAYFYHQATTPDTIGVAMKDSPSGLLSYLLQFFFFGRVLDRRENAGVRIDNHIPRDVLLDNIMLYWMTGSIGTSMRMYAETYNRRVWAMNIDGNPSPVLTWMTEPQYELIHHPYWILKKKYPNLISYKTLDFGGHFFAYEFPEFATNEVLTAITVFRKKTNRN